MAYRIVVQDGNIVYQTSDPAYGVNFGITGQLFVSDQINVGSNPLTAGVITTAPGQDLQIETGTGGNLKLLPSGSLLLNNVAWPTGTLNITPGQFLGASALNTLAFYPFVIAFAGSDTLTQAQLIATYPNAQPGQSVIGPNVVYQCVSANTWRILGPPGGGVSPGGSNQSIQYNNSGAFAGNSNFTYDYVSNKVVLNDPSSAGNTLTFSFVGTGGTPAKISNPAIGLELACGSTTLTVSGGVVATIAAGGNFEVAGNTTTYINYAGAFGPNAQFGTSGQVLTSQGSSSPPTWTTPSAGGGSTAMVLLLASALVPPDGNQTTNWVDFAIVQPSPDVSWDSVAQNLVFTSPSNNMYQVTIQYAITWTGLGPSGIAFPNEDGNYGSGVFGFLPGGPTFTPPPNFNVYFNNMLLSTHTINATTPPRYAWTPTLNSLMGSDTFTIQDNQSAPICVYYQNYNSSFPSAYQLQATVTVIKVS